MMVRSLIELVLDSVMAGEPLEAVLDTVAVCSESDIDPIVLCDHASLKRKGSTFHEVTGRTELPLHMYFSDKMPKGAADKLKQAEDKFGADKVASLVRVLSDAIDTQSNLALSKLEKLHKVIAFLSPMQRPPRILYRGMSGLKSVPRAGQKIVYTSFKFPYSRWSKKLSVVKEFANLGDRPAIILAAEGSKLAGSSTIVFWPQRPSSPLAYHYSVMEYANEKEWVFKIKKPVQVSAYKILT